MSEQVEKIQDCPTTGVTIYDFEVLPQEAHCPICHLNVGAVFLPERVCSVCAGLKPETSESETEPTSIPETDSEDELWWPSTLRGA